MYKKFLGLTGIFLTFIKPLFAAGIIWLLINQRLKSAAAAIFLLMISDIFDGILFRKSPYAAIQNLKKIRRLADSIGDKLAIHSISLTMIMFNGFPLGLYLILITRELFLLILLLRRGYIIRRPIPKAGLLHIAARLTLVCAAFAAISWLVAETTLSLVLASLITVFGSIHGAYLIRSLRRAE